MRKNKQPLNTYLELKEQGSILVDFNTLLQFFIDKQIRATDKTRSLPLDILSKLNAVLTKPAIVHFKRPQLKSYPQVRGIYWLLRGSGLLKVRHIDKQIIFQVNTDKVKLWRQLNFVEQYFYLLELWWFRCPKELIGDRDWYGSPKVFELFHFWKNFQKKGEVIFKDYEAFRQTMYLYGSHQIALHYLFGLIVIEEFPTQADSGWGVKKIILSRWGQTIISLVNNSIAQKLLAENSRVFDDIEKPGILHKLFGQYFSDWKFIEFPKSSPIKKKGALVFKVSLPKWSVLIVIADSNTWVDLSDLILEAVAFEDTMHLYDFDFVDDRGVHHRFIHPEGERMDVNDQLADTKIGESTLEKGQEIIYTFDYGDNWEFQLVLEEIKKENLQEPKIISVKEKPPLQYGNETDWI